MNYTEIIHLNHASFLIRAVGIKLIIDPYGIVGNKDLEKYQKEILSADIILITHGHNDHMADATTILKASPNSNYICKQGVPTSQTIGLNKGSTIKLVDGIKLSAVHAEHSSGLQDGSYGGEPIGYVIHTGPHHIYHCGDTAVFGDMKLINDMYKPNIALLCIGGHYTMGPYEAGYAVNNLLTAVKYVIPMHYGFPPVDGSPAELRKHVTRPDVEIIELKNGDLHKF